MTAAWLGPLPDPHTDCPGVPWSCWSCGRTVCPRCEPSPAEYAHCAECHYFIGAMNEQADV